MNISQKSASHHQGTPSVSLTTQLLFATSLGKAVTSGTASDRARVTVATCLDVLR